MMRHSYFVWLIGSIVYSVSCYGSDQQTNMIGVQLKSNRGAPIIQYDIPVHLRYSFIDPYNTPKKVASVAIQQTRDRTGAFCNSLNIVLSSVYKPNDEPNDTLNVGFSLEASHQRFSLAMPKSK